MTLTPSEGKRLIGKAVASMDVVQNALREGTIVIATSTTTAYVYEELLGEEIADKGMFTAGVITAKSCCITDPKDRYQNKVITKGEVEEMAAKDLPKVLAKMGPADVFIKGANAIDPFGQAGILLGGAGGGTIGKVWGHITANGVTAIFAVGLEKLVPISLADIAPRTGIESVDTSLGMAVGMMVVGGSIITEMEAFKLLVGVEAYPIAGVRPRLLGQGRAAPRDEGPELQDLRREVPLQRERLADPGLLLFVLDLVCSIELGEALEGLGEAVFEGLVWFEPGFMPG
jgi:hypothetical protein